MVLFFIYKFVNSVTYYRGLWFAWLSSFDWLFWVTAQPPCRVIYPNIIKMLFIVKNKTGEREDLPSHKIKICIYCHLYSYNNWSMCYNNSTETRTTTGIFLCLRNTSIFTPTPIMSSLYWPHTQINCFHKHSPQIKWHRNFHFFYSPTLF